MCSKRFFRHAKNVLETESKGKKAERSEFQKAFTHSMLPDDLILNLFLLLFNPKVLFPLPNRFSGWKMVIHFGTKCSQIPVPIFQFVYYSIMVILNHFQITTFIIITPNRNSYGLQIYVGLCFTLGWIVFPWAVEEPPNSPLTNTYYFNELVSMWLFLTGTSTSSL